MQRKLYGKLGVQCLKSSCVCGVIDRIKPNLLFDRLVEHGRVISGVDGAKARSQRADALIAVHVDFQELYRQRIARFSSIDEKRPGERIVARCHAERVAWFFNRVAKAVHRIRLKNIAGLQMRDWTVRRGIGVFKLTGFQFIADDFAFFRALRERGSGKQQHSQNSFHRMGSSPGFYRKGREGREDRRPRIATF